MHIIIYVVIQFVSSYFSLFCCINALRSNDANMCLKLVLFPCNVALPRVLTFKKSACILTYMKTYCFVDLGITLQLNRNQNDNKYISGKLHPQKTSSKNQPCTRGLMYQIDKYSAWHQGVAIISYSLFSNAMKHALKSRLAYFSFSIKHEHRTLIQNNIQALLPISLWNYKELQ